MAKAFDVQTTHEHHSASLRPRFLLLTGLVVAAALSRLIPVGVYNFAPIGAMALFGAACFASRRTAILIPLLAMLASDVLLYSLHYREYSVAAVQTQASVYLAFAMILGLGLRLRNRPQSTLRILGYSVSGSVLFFLVTNFGAWAMDPIPGFTQLYEKSFSGLMTCYVAGLPFFRGTLAGDLFFNAMLFGTLAFAESRVPSLRRLPEGVAS